MWRGALAVALLAGVAAVLVWASEPSPTACAPPPEATTAAAPASQRGQGPGFVALPAPRSPAEAPPARATPAEAVPESPAVPFSVQGRPTPRSDGAEAHGSLPGEEELVVGNLDLAARAIELARARSSRSPTLGRLEQDYADASARQFERLRQAGALSIEDGGSGGQ